jgi:GNAT superfamily N-acetyltransferase
MPGQTAIQAIEGTSTSTERQRRQRAFLAAIPGLRQHVRLRMAKIEDVPELTRIIRGYMKSTDWDFFVEFDYERCANYLEAVIGTPFVPHLIAEERTAKSGIVGILSYELIQDFSRAPIATGHTLWVRKDYHRTALARHLIDTFLDLAQGDGASVIHLPVMSNLPEARSLKNLLRKKGFHEMGYVMRKGL